MKKAILNLFLLLITILSFTKLSAQDCEIIVSFVETYECDAANGTYSIDFGIEVGNATNDSVDIWVNNDFIGQYEIQDFLTIDNILLQNDTDEAILLVCVHDNTQCCFVSIYEEPECEEECDFEYLEVEAVCDENGNYTLIIEYGINNPLSDLLFLWVNGDLYGEYEIQPDGFGVLELGNVETSGNDLGSILLCSGEGESCCEDASYEQPECEGEACSVDYIEVETSECENGTYTLTIYYGISNPGNDFLDLWVNNDYYDDYEIDADGEGVIVVENVEPRENTPWDIVEICVNDNDNCCLVFEYLHPECEEECDFEYLEVEAVCDENGNYTLIIEYGINNPLSDLLFLWVNGDLYGEYEIQPDGFGVLEIGNVETSGNDLGSILLCSGESESCCEDASYEQPECGEGECSFEYLEVEAVCDENGNYTLIIEYGINNPQGDFLGLWINGDFYDEYEIQDNGNGVIEVGNVEPSGNGEGSILLCSGDGEGCCEDAGYEEPECDEEDCSINWIEIEVLDCDGDTYGLEIYYEVTNPGNDFIELWAGGDYIGFYEINGEPISLDGLNWGDAGDVIEIQLCVNDMPDCCLEAEFEVPNCEGEECNFEYLEVTAECNDDGNYTLIIEYGINNPQGDFLGLWINGDFYDEYEIQDNGNGVIEVGNVEPTGNGEGSILLCSGDGEGCCEDAGYEEPECDGEECSVDYIEVETSECDGGTYTLTIFYGISNPGNDFLDLWVNNDFVGNYEIDADGEGMIIVENVEPRPNTDWDIVEICVNDNPDCCLALEYLHPGCESEDCSFDYIEYSIECNDEGNYALIIEYGVNNPQGDFLFLWFNGDFYDEYEIQPDGTGIIEASNITPVDGDFGSFLLCSGEGEGCCEVVEYEQPECDGEECDITFLEVTAECQEDGNYTLFIEYDVINPIDEFVIVSVNGVNYGDFDHDMTGSFEIEDIEPVEGEDFGFIVLCSDETGDLCCAEAEYEQPECESEECSINWIEIDVLDCDGDTYGLEIYYEVTNPGNDFIELWAGGDYIGFYEINGEPISLDGLDWGDAGDVIEIQLCVNDVPDCCLESEFEVPDCTDGAQDDIPPYSIIVDSDSDEIILTPLNKLPYNMMMFSMDAKLLQKSEEEEGITRMPVNEPGIYIVRVETERKVFYSKILYIQ